MGVHAGRWPGNLVRILLVIRSVTVDEIKTLLYLGSKFWKEGNLPGQFIEEVFERRWSDFIAGGTGRIFAAFVGSQPVGAIGMVFAKDFNDDARVASEAFWFVREDHRGIGLRLFAHAEKYAKASGCKRIAMVHLIDLHPAKLQRFYERSGFRCVENVYLKTF